MNILLTSVGRRSYLVEYFKEALGKDGKVYVANSTNITPAFGRANSSVVTPLIYNENYISFLKQYCLENDIQLIISLFDIDLPILTKNKKVFEEIGVKVLVSDEYVIEICNDKWKTYGFLKDNGFYVPQTFLSIEETLQAVEKSEIKFPIIIKPRWGMGSLGVQIAENEEELKVFYKSVLRKIQNSYLKYEAKMFPERCIIMQEILQGQELGIDIINDLQGEYQNAIVKKKYTMRSGETDCAVTVKWEVAENVARKLSLLLRHIGNLDVDIFDVDGKPYVLELNARFGGGYPFSHLAGVNLPKAIIDWVNGNKTNPLNLQYRAGIVGHKDIAIVKILEAEVTNYK